MHTQISRFLGVFAILVLAANIASATIVTLPDTTSSVTFTATVVDQCNVVELPGTISFNVTDHTSAIIAIGTTVTINNIIVAEGKKIRLSIAPIATDFNNTLGFENTKSTTWSSSAVSWGNGGTWTTGTGVAGTMSAELGHYVEVATSGVNSATLSTVKGALVFTLAADEDIVRSGDYTLAATWKIEGGI